MTTAVFDVDGTLIYEMGDREDTPRYDVVDLYRKLERFGCEMWIWSGGGEDYAASWAVKLGLVGARIAEKGSFVPDIAVDNEVVELGRVNIKV